MWIAAALAGLTSAQLQVAVLASPGELSERVRIEIDAFEAKLAEENPALDLAVVYCDEPQRAFGTGLRGLASFLEGQSKSSPERCPTSIDGVDRALEELEWKEHAEKRIVIIGDRPNNRTTLEEAMHRAERAGIVVHGLEIRAHDFRLDGWTVLSDVRRFLARPTEPLGRGAFHLRHAILINGGTHHVLITWERQWGLEAGKGLFDILKHARVGDRDALEDLASGRRRPSEVKPSELPRVLWNIDLEPLLDAVFDFVDARRVAESAERQIAKQIPKGQIGRELAAGVLGPRRLMPSRR